MRWCMLRNNHNLGQIIAACLLCLENVCAAPAVTFAVTFISLKDALGPFQGFKVDHGKQWNMA